MCKAGLIGEPTQRPVSPLQSEIALGALPRLEPTWELMEYICQENNTNVPHIQGPAKIR
jgi:hypothetical protein